MPATAHSRRAVGIPAAVSPSAMTCSVHPAARSCTMRLTTPAGRTDGRPSRTPLARFAAALRGFARWSGPRCATAASTREGVPDSRGRVGDVRLDLREGALLSGVRIPAGAVGSGAGRLGRRGGGRPASPAGGGFAEGWVGEGAEPAGWSGAGAPGVVPRLQRVGGAPQLVETEVTWCLSADPCRDVHRWAETALEV